MKDWKNKEVLNNTEVDYDKIKEWVSIKEEINGYTFFAKEVLENVIVITGENRYAISDMFMRLSEYYEGESDELRGLTFSYEKCIDICAKGNNDRLEYTNTYDGFNVPSSSVVSFFDSFENFTEKENFILKAVFKHMTEGKHFYLLGVHLDADAGDHEISHAFWYLYPEYRENISNFIHETFDVEFLDGLSIRLKEMDYTENVIPDEIQAYLCTSDIPYLLKWFKKLDWDWYKVEKSMSYFNEFHKIKIEEWKQAIKKNSY